MLLAQVFLHPPEEVLDGPVGWCPDVLGGMQGSILLADVDLDGDDCLWMPVPGACMR